MRVLVYDNHQWWDRFAKTEVQNVGRSAVYTLVRDETATLASVRWHALTADEQATGLAELRELYERDLPVERANHLAGPTGAPPPKITPQRRKAPPE